MAQNISDAAEFHVPAKSKIGFGIEKLVRLCVRSFPSGCLCFHGIALILHLRGKTFWIFKILNVRRFLLILLEICRLF